MGRRQPPAAHAPRPHRASRHPWVSVRADRPVSRCRRAAAPPRRRNRPPARPRARQGAAPRPAARPTSARTTCAIASTSPLAWAPPVGNTAPMVCLAAETPFSRIFASGVEDAAGSDKSGPIQGLREIACKPVGSTLIHLYSVAAVTDTTGAVVERYGYDAYGDSVVLDASGLPVAGNESFIGQPYRFTGRRLDQETGLSYFRARYMDHELGRFVGRDPVMEAPVKPEMPVYQGDLDDIQKLSAALRLLSDLRAVQSVLISGGSLEIDSLLKGLRSRPVALDGYRDGMSRYSAYFSPNFTDPTGMTPCRGVGDPLTTLSGFDCCLNKCLMFWAEGTMGRWCAIPGLIAAVPHSKKKAPYLTTGLFKKVMNRAAVCCVGWLVGILIGCEAKCLGDNGSYDDLVD